MKTFFRIIGASVTLVLLGASSGLAAVLTPARFDYAWFTNYLATVAHPGDIVQLPAGTNSWTGVCQVSGLELFGATNGQTMILDEGPENGNECVFNMVVADTSHFTHISGIYFGPGVTNSYPYVSYSGLIQVSGPGWDWRIDHCSFVRGTDKPIRVLDLSYGVIDHNYFLMNTNIANAIEIFGSGSGFGDGPWAMDPMFGTSNFTFVEDNTFASVVNFATEDVAYGGRVVVRHNNFNGTWVYTHGSDSSGRYRGSRAVEVYSNNFEYGNTMFANSQYAVRIDSGTALIYNNRCTNFYNVAAYEYYRSTDNRSGFAPWWGTTPTNVYDTIATPVATNIASATSSSVLTVNGVNWTPNQWYGYEVFNPNTGLIGSCNGNSSNTMSFALCAVNGDQLGFTAGDSAVIYFINAGFDQPGRGKGYNYGESGTPAAINPAENSEPIHAWGNLDVWNGTSASGAIAYSGNYPEIVAGRDYTNTPLAGYTAFTYPHPLTLITNGTGGGSGGQPGTNSLPYTLQIQYIPAH
jgi:hypothetical protein